MRYETFKFIIDNKHRLFFDDAVGTGSDNSTDLSASTINPNSFLIGDVGSYRSLKRLLVTILLIMLILYVFKKL